MDYPCDVHGDVAEFTPFATVCDMCMMIQLARRIAAKTGIRPKKVHAVLKEIVSVVSDNLANGNSVRFGKMMTMKTRTTPARPFRLKKVCGVVRRCIPKPERTFVSIFVHSRFEYEVKLALAARSDANEEPKNSESD